MAFTVLSAFLCLPFLTRQPLWLPQLLGLLERDRSGITLLTVPPETSQRQYKHRLGAEDIVSRYRGFP